jgi:chlorite dismutase
MKRARIVVGGHYAGKSKTIKEYVKPQLGIGKRARKFTLNGQIGRVFTQSFEEANRDVRQSVKVYIRFGIEVLILACRPATESGSRLQELTSELKTAGYEVETIDIVALQPESYYKAKADEIVSSLTELKKSAASA